MIQLFFLQGSRYRKVFIKDRKIAMMTPELGGSPITLDLDALDTKETLEKMNSMKLTSEDRIAIQEMGKLKDPAAIAKDIIRDFQQSGWRCVKRNGLN